MESATLPEIVPKRIIVCCDGTWYASDKGGNNLPSNVTRMSRALKKVGVVEHGKDKGQPRAQVVYYQSGVGTGNLGVVDKMWQGAFGAGLDENVCSAYNFLANNYAPGDDIFLFGFSRGAFTARAVAGLVCHAGLLKPHCMELFYEMYKAYQGREPASKNRPEQKLADTKWANDLYKTPYQTQEDVENNGEHPTNWEVYKDHSDQDVQIKVVGVWDTVGSLGLPEGPVTRLTGSSQKYKFHNTGLDPKIRHAFHALALDEHRGSFSPSLWYLPKGTSEDEQAEEKLHKETRLIQCWFPGYHGNIGGGTVGEGKDDNDIDEITFAWMCDLVKPYLTFDRDAINQIIPSKTKLPPMALLKRTTTQPTGKMISKPTLARTSTPKTQAQSSPVEKADYATSELSDSYNITWKPAGGSKIREPGQIKPRGDAGVEIEGVDTREFMHPCVAYRQEHGDRKCPSLAPVYSGWTPWTRVVETEWKHQTGEGGKGFAWVKWNNLMQKEIVKIPQYIIPKYKTDDGIGSLERLLIPDEYMEELDKVNFGVQGNGLAIKTEC